MADTERWKDEAKMYGWSIIKAAGDDPDLYPYVYSDGVRKGLGIYSASKGDRVLTITAPTYYELFRAAQAAWNTYTFIKRAQQ